MSSPAPLELDQAAPPESDVSAPSRARIALFKRLADVVCLPASRVNTFERSMTADLLADMLREAPLEDRLRVARRLASLAEIPASLVRLLLRDQVGVAQALLENCTSLSESDLLDCVRHTSADHRRLVALRRGVGEVVAEALVEAMEPPVVEALLRNELARLSNAAVETVVAASRDEPKFIPQLLRRPELRPHHAYVMFWWANSEARKTILQRFAVSREVLQDATDDVFAIAADEGWSDPISRKALQFIERRQRSRQAQVRSRFASLEEAVAEAQSGMTREIAEEISYLSELKPMTGVKIFTDVGGEPLAILCKATGLPRSTIRVLWKALHRPTTAASGAPAPALERVLITYDMIAIDRAQTVLRYWNWALSSAMTPALLRAVRREDEEGIEDYSTPQWDGPLALRNDLAT